MMRIFEPHAHMVARTTNDYEAMARAGIEVIVEPAFWLGETRKYPGSFFDYFDHLSNFEHTRAGRYGIKQFVTLAMNPREANQKELAQSVIKELPRYLEHPNVVGIGEIGFDRMTPEEEDAFIQQAELGRKCGLPLLVHSPHIQKKRGIVRLIELLRKMDFEMESVLIDHNVEETTPISKDAGAWCGHTVYPITKLSPERTANILQQNGFDKMMINAAPDWGPSDPLMVPYTVQELSRRGVSDRDIQKLVWDNPVMFFSKSGRLRL